MPNLEQVLAEAAREIVTYAPPYKLDELPEAEALKAPLPWGRQAPKPMPLKNRKPNSALPQADVVVITWTVAEGYALADVLTPGYRDVRPGKKPPRNTKPWYTYRPSNFKKTYVSQMRASAPGREANRLGTYFLTTVTNDRKKRPVRVLCFKSELHFNRDWLSSGPNRKRAPVADLFLQIIDEARPKLVITVGTAGATLGRTALGDVMMTRAAQFRLSRAFKRAPYNDGLYRCTSIKPINGKHLASAKALLETYRQYLDPRLVTRTPRIWQDGVRGNYRAYLPILTTDRFEYGTSRGKNENYLGDAGCGVEMGDAFLGMVVKYLAKPTKEKPWQVAIPEPEGLETPPDWLVIRNASDPQIDADLSITDQVKEAVFYYKKYGYFTSVNSAIAVWAAIRGATGL